MWSESERKMRTTDIRERGGLVRGGRGGTASVLGGGTEGEESSRRRRERNTHEVNL